MAEGLHAPSGHRLLPTGAEPGNGTGFASHASRHESSVRGLGSDRPRESAGGSRRACTEAEGPGACSGGGGGWASAQYLELIPQDKGTLVSGDERHMLKREQESALRLNSTPLPTPWGGGGSSKGGWPAPGASWQGKGWWNPWNTSHFQPTWKGKGKGKDKGGKKGKSKDKGDSAPPPPPN